MKKIVIALSLLFLFATNLYAALGAATAWEVRAAGNNSNGAGYNSANATPGTDFSQQDAAQDSGTDLASADGDAVPCVVTSASHNFVDADEGNLIQITETGDGFTVGYYEIVTTAANAATLDRACGTDGAKTGGDWFLGGAAADPEQVTSAVVAGNTVHIKAGTYNVILDTDVAGAATTLINWVGYNATRGDNPTGTNRPLIDGASTRANCIVSDQTYNRYANIRVSGATGDGILSTAITIYENVKSSSNSGDGFDDSINSSGFYYSNCESASNTGVGDKHDGGGSAGSRHFYSYVHDNSGAGITAAGNVGAYYYSVAETNAGTGLGGAAASINSISYGNTGATTDGFSLGGNAAIVNNIAMNNGDEGFLGTSGNYHLFLNNISAANTGDEFLGIDYAVGNITTDPSLTDPANGDYTISAGSSALNAGYAPSSISGFSGTYAKYNIGIDQDDNTTDSTVMPIYGG